ncbi:ISL3 family transposase [Nocardia sp. CA-135398]|uniref:ISL3 family transposase n=1 Tax=Nocardia sp. CA-135398 TaxID=3239977 RepID=UPI003D96087B
MLLVAVSVVESVCGVLFPHLSGVRVDGVEARGSTVWFDARTDTETAACPTCGTTSGRVHSRYVRYLSDRSVGGREVRIRLRVRRFRCSDRQCSRVIFAERLGELAGWYQRRSRVLTSLLTVVGLALGGRAGHRMTRHLATEVSRSTLLRLVRAIPLPQVGALPTVGIDDFAIRRGRVYGTIIVDMATRQPVDLLEDRTSDTVADWLRQHPEVRVVCRDRGGPYADGASRGAPAAIQVADRWHLLHNLTTAVDRVVRAHRKCLVQQEDTPDSEQEPVTPETAPAGSGSRAEAIRQRYADIHELFNRGVNISVISERLRLDRKTVRRYVQADSVEHLLAPVAKRGSALDDHTPYLRQRWDEGCTNALRLLEEVRERGYTGSHRSVRRLVQTWRVATPPAATNAPAAPTPRDVAGWMMRPTTALSDDEKRQLQQILAGCDTLRQVNQLVADFAGMVRERGGKHLDTWIAAAQASGIKQLASFADGLLKDYDAVRNGLTLEWSSGAVEGNVNRVKMLMRQMFGRANFDLLRRRVLLVD